MNLHIRNASLMAVSAATVSLLTGTSTLSGRIIKIAAAALWGYKVSKAYHFTIRLGPHLIRDYCHEFMLRDTAIWTCGITLLAYTYTDIYSLALLVEIPSNIIGAYFLAFATNTLLLCRLSRNSIFSLNFIGPQPNTLEVDLFSDGQTSGRQP